MQRLSATTCCACASDGCGHALRKTAPRRTGAGPDAGRAAGDAPPDRIAGATPDERSLQSSTTANETADRDGLQLDPARRPSDRTPDPAAAENPAPIPTPPPVTGRLAEAGPGYATADTGSPAVSNQHSQFFKRLSPEVGRDIVYLKVSGHYVEVTASGGSDMILMRLADAVDALGGLGMQVHRSYWASFNHMRRLVRREGRMLLRLTDGREVPVSRPYLKAVRAVLPPQARAFAVQRVAVRPPCRAAAGRAQRLRRSSDDWQPMHSNA